MDSSCDRAETDGTAAEDQGSPWLLLFLLIKQLRKRRGSPESRRDRDELTRRPLLRTPQLPAGLSVPPSPALLSLPNHVPWWDRSRGAGQAPPVTDPALGEPSAV